MQKPFHVMIWTHSDHGGDIGWCALSEEKYEYSSIDDAIQYVYSDEFKEKFGEAPWFILDNECTPLVVGGEPDAQYPSRIEHLQGA